jgi:hypothetical protein
VVSCPAAALCVSTNTPGGLEATIDVAATAIPVVAGTAALSAASEVDGIVTCGKVEVDDDNAFRLDDGVKMSADGAVNVMVAGGTVN